MKLEYVPLLAKQRELYGLPGGAERFQEYLRTMIDPKTSDLRLPLSATNPMSKDHAPRLLDALAAIGADEVGAQAAAEADAVVAEVPGEFRVGLVVSDDAGGGWTNRAAAELAHRRGEQALLKRRWITGILWTSQKYDRAEIREEILTSVFRAATIARRGRARSLRELLVQEGNAMRMAGARNPALEPHTLLATRQILFRLLDHDDMPTLVAAVFGDAAARELGYPPLGLRSRAGLALALHGRLEPRRKRESRP
ncbi:MAG: hypothetical protein WEB59_08440 [Thermoanaerobaculia bacterium]